MIKEINEILGEKLSAEDEEEILAEFENLETQVCAWFQFKITSTYCSCIILPLFLFIISVAGGWPKRWV